VTPLMGTALLAEYEDVLGRDALFERSRLDADERASCSTSQPDADGDASADQQT